MLTDTYSKHWKITEGIVMSHFTELIHKNQQAKQLNQTPPHYVCGVPLLGKAHYCVSTATVTKWWYTGW